MPSQQQISICKMFDRIAPTYDRINRLLSFGKDAGWRRFVASQIPHVPGLAFLDVATGTSDLLLAVCEGCPGFAQATGVDLSEAMLAAGQKKIDQAPFRDRVKLEIADAASLPYRSASFDIATMAFGIRNVIEPEGALSELARVLVPGGRLFILEFSIPDSSMVRWIYLFYFRRILPLVGGILSREPDAYRYLNRSVEAFPTVSEFKAVIMRNGFSNVDSISLSFGIATVYAASKPA